MTDTKKSSVTKANRGTNAIVFAILAIGIVALINIVSSKKFGRLDLTEEKIYTLSEASKKMVAALPDRVTVKAFISSDLPPQVRPYSRYLRDMLEEYATYSGGKFAWEAIDPIKDEKAKETANQYKVPPGRLSVFEKAKASVSEFYLGLGFQYAGKIESIPAIGDISNLEYQVSSMLRRLTTKQKKIGFTTGHGEPSFYQGLGAAKEELKDYEVVPVDLTEGKTPIPADIDLLVVLGPQTAFAEKAKYEIDQFLMKGKSVAFFVNGMVMETPRGQMAPGQQMPRIARENNTGLQEMLENYGVKVGTDIVMDMQNARVMLPVGNQRVVTNYPGFPVVTNIAGEMAITKTIKGFIGIFPGSLELSQSVRDGKAGVKATVLASSSEASWKHSGIMIFDPLHPPVPPQNIEKDHGPYALAVYLEGKFNSFFAGKPVPAAGPATTPPGAPGMPADKKADGSKPSGQGQTSPDRTRIVVVGDANLVNDQYLGLYPDNLKVLLNTVDYLAEDESLIAIRAKTQTRRPLKQAEESTITIAQYANVVGLPVMFIGFGLVRWWLRKGRRVQRAKELLGEKAAKKEVEKKDEAGSNNPLSN